MPDHRGHETVKVEGCPYTEEGEALDIDVLLAPLIREMWRLEIETEHCCQEEWPGLASIVFPGTGEAADFLWVAQENYKAELETWDDGEDGEHCIQLNLRVNFPTADIPRLVRLFARAERDQDGELSRGAPGDSNGSVN